MTKIHGKTAIVILCVCVLLYIPVQWVAGAAPGSTSIFSAQHREMEQNFLEVTAALRQQLLFECAHRGVHDIYLSDGDVITPYLVNEVQAQPGCLIHRETVVTMQDDAPRLACSSVFVDEDLPNAWNAMDSWDYLGTLEGKMSIVSLFESQDKRFNFRLWQANNCVHKEVASGLDAGARAGEMR